MQWDWTNNAFQIKLRSISTKLEFREKYVYYNENRYLDTCLKISDKQNIFNFMSRSFLRFFEAIFLSFYPIHVKLFCDPNILILFSTVWHPIRSIILLRTLYYKKSWATYESPIPVLSVLPLPWAASCLELFLQLL